MMKWMVALVVCGGLAFAACGGDDETTGGSSCGAADVAGIDYAAGSEVSGQSVYGTGPSGTCSNDSTCHGDDGTGSNSNAENLAVQVPNLSNEQIAIQIRCGIGTMPAQATLSDGEIADVIAYLRQQFP